AGDRTTRCHECQHENPTPKWEVGEAKHDQAQKEEPNGTKNPSASDSPSSRTRITFLKQAHSVSPNRRSRFATCSMRAIFGELGRGDTSPVPDWRGLGPPASR